jgi:hypothetical protein
MSRRSREVCGNVTSQLIKLYTDGSSTPAKQFLTLRLEEVSSLKRSHLVTWDSEPTIHMIDFDINVMLPNN